MKVAFEVRQEEACKVYNCTEYSGVVSDTAGGRMHMIPSRIRITLSSFTKRCFPNPELYPGQQSGGQKRGFQGIPGKKIRLLSSKKVPEY
jgi:hypothetical protein